MQNLLRGEQELRQGEKNHVKEIITCKEWPKKLLMIVYRRSLQISPTSPASLAQVVTTIPAAKFSQLEQTNLFRSWF
jgi:hypothetical protein